MALTRRVVYSASATASLVTMLLREEGIAANAFVIAPACCVSLDVAERAESFITTVVHNDDVVRAHACAPLRQRCK